MWCDTRNLNPLLGDRGLDMLVSDETRDWLSSKKRLRVRAHTLDNRWQLRNNIAGLMMPATQDRTDDHLCASRPVFEKTWVPSLTLAISDGGLALAANKDDYPAQTGQINDLITNVLDIKKCQLK